MILLLAVIITLNAFVTANNDSNSDLLEALQYLQTAHAKHYKEGDPKLVVPTPNVLNPDILSVIHNLRPDVLHRPADYNNLEEHGLPMLESRDVEDVETNAVSNLDSDKRRRVTVLLKTLLEAKKAATHRPRTQKKAKFGTDPRRMMSWFQNLFGTTTTATTTVKDDINATDLRVTPLVDNSDLTAVLSKLSRVLEKLNDNIVSQTLRSNRTSGFFIVKMPIKTDIYQDFHSNSRRKREITNATEKNAQDKKHANVTDDKEKESRRTNGRMLGKHQFNINEQLHPDNNIVNVNSEIKQKLIEHLIGSFDDIRNKIAALNDVKKIYSGDTAYRIGYILANIDTLDVNLSKLRHDLENNRYMWDERKILNLFDRLKSSDNVIGKLIELVKSYASKEI